MPKFNNMEKIKERIAELQQRKQQLLNGLEQHKAAISQCDGAIMELSRLVESEKQTEEKAEANEEAPN